jgi:pimeloyl-ACP methyl ester carboxylesterase
MQSDTKVSRCYISGNYGQLHLRESGQLSEKTTIICLHMAPKSGRSFNKIMPYLGSDRLVIAPDYPGYGESDHPPAEPNVTVENYAEAIGEVIATLNLKSVNLIGYHTGSMVAVEVARQQPSVVKKLINISAPIFTQLELDHFRDYFAPISLDTEGSRFRIMWERIMKYRGPGMTLEDCAVSMAENMRGGENYEWGHHAAFNYTHDYTRHLSKISQPLLVMNPKDDLYEQTKRVDPFLNMGTRTDFLDWGTGFLDAFSEPVAQEMLRFFDKN